MLEERKSAAEELDNNPWSSEISPKPRPQTVAAQAPLTYSSSRTWHPKLHERISTPSMFNSSMIQRTEGSGPASLSNTEVTFDNAYLAIAWYDFVPDVRYEEIGLTEGDLVLILNTNGHDGWWQACKVGNWEEYFPGESRDFIKTTATIPADHPCRAISEDLMKQWEGEEWKSLEESIIGFIPAAYVQTIASRTNAEIENVTFNAETAEGFTVEDDTPQHTMSPYMPHRILQRFHPFVVSGAEEFILTGGEEVPDSVKSRISFLNGLSPTFSSFVNSTYSTAKSIVGSGSGEVLSDSQNLEEQQFNITDGPRWEPLHCANPEFYLFDPLHRSQWGGLSEWTVYGVSYKVAENHYVAVARRYSHFRLLQHYFSIAFPIVLVPELPVRQFNGRFRHDFVEKRRGALERWITRVARHPILATSEGYSIFILSGAWSLQDSDQSSRSSKTYSAKDADLMQKYSNSEIVYEESMKKLIDSLDSISSGSLLLKSIYHPAYNLPADEAFVETGRQSLMPESNESLYSQLENGNMEGLGTVSAKKDFLKKMSRKTDGVQAALENYKNLTLHNFRKDLKKVACSLQRLVSVNSRPSSTSNIDSSLPDRSDESEDTARFSYADSLSEQFEALPAAGRFSWCQNGPSCESCRHLTHAIQAVSRTFSTLAGLQTDFSAECLSPLIDHVGEWSKMEGRWNFGVQVHEETMNVGKSLIQSSSSNTEENEIPPFLRNAHMLSRVATVLNANHAELDFWFHRERVVEWSEILEKWIDAELERLAKWTALMENCRNVVSQSCEEARKDLK